MRASYMRTTLNIWYYVLSVKSDSSGRHMAFSKPEPLPRGALWLVVTLTGPPMSPNGPLTPPLRIPDEIDQGFRKVLTTDCDKS